MKWSSKEDDYVKQNYAAQGAIKIASILNRTYASVKHRAIKFKIKSLVKNSSRRNSLNEKSFEIITKKSAYWAGFIAADGCIYNNKLSMGLAEKDLFQMKELLNFLKSSAKITFNKKQKSVGFSISSKKICKDLYNNFNITSNKSLTLKPPTKLKRPAHKISFIKGYIDGDGCIGLYPNRLILSILGTKEVLEWIDNTLLEIISTPKRNIRKIKNIHEIAYYGKLAKKVLTFIKKSTKNGLNRKWDKVK